MKKLNALAIKTFDKLLALSDEELKAKFDALNSSDLSEILSQSGMFESAKTEADIVYGSGIYDHTLNEASMAATFITQIEEAEEICTEAINDLTYAPILNELWLTPTLNIPSLNIPVLNVPTINIPTLNIPTLNLPNVLTASQILASPAPIWTTNFDELWSANADQMEVYVPSNPFAALDLELEPVAPDYKKAA